MALNKVVPVIGLVAVLMIFSSYTFGVLSENDGQIDVEDTDYQDAYDSNVAIQSSSSLILSPMAWILSFIGFLIVVGTLRRSRH